MPRMSSWRRIGHRPSGRLLLVVSIAGWAAVGCSPSDDEPVSPSAEADSTLQVGEVLGGDPEGYEIADGSRSLRFPRDHGPHPDFRSEWWYVTGNLSGPEGDFGYQFTIFRTALTPDQEPRRSAWATRQVYMGHLAVGDFAGRRFRAWDRFARGALGLAGARVAPFRVWLEDWSLEQEDLVAGGASAPDDDVGAGADASSGPGDDLAGLLPLRLRAAEEDVTLDLRLDRDRPLVLQGDAGTSRKGALPANASYYYSVTRLRTSGVVEIAGRRHEVEGLSWLDREWSTSALEPGQVGWDWFSLQLDDGTDLMLYVMRRDDGSEDPHSSGVEVGPRGVRARLRHDDFRVEVLDTWTSPDSGATYPARWRLRVPSRQLDLEVVPRMSAQELNLAFRYWEGAVGVSGSHGGVPVAGRGFVELTGY